MQITLVQLSLHLAQPQPVGDNETVLPFLETFVLNDNPLCYLPDTLFKPLRNSNVTRLYLKNCNINEFCKFGLYCVLSFEKYFWGDIVDYRFQNLSNTYL